MEEARLLVRRGGWASRERGEARAREKRKGKGGEEGEVREETN